MFFECEDLQARLTAALSLNHEIQFKFILCDLQTNPNKPQECFGNLSIFEKVLVTPKRGRFIDLCMRNDADFFMKNDLNQFPLHYAVSSLCPENVKRLFANVLSQRRLSSKNKQILFSNIVNEKLENGNNYLHNLISAMDAKNLEDVSEIVKAFVTNGCSMNTPNDQLETPFYLLLKKMETLPVDSHLVKFALRNQEIDFFSHKSAEIGKMMKELHLGYEVNRSRINVKDLKYMLRLLEHRDERKFFEELPNFQRQTQSVDEFNDGLARFLRTSAATNLCEVIEVLLEYGADVNASANGSCGPAFIACVFGHYSVLEILLEMDSLKLSCDIVNRNLLHQICMAEDIHALDRQRCFSLIVNDHRCTTDIINGLDKNVKSPLYYACSNGLHEIAENLLKRGAFIGHPSVVHKMDGKAFEEFLDSCIKPSTKLSDTKCKIRVDYRFLMPPKNEKPSRGEAESLQKLAESEELHELLLHPVISSFLQLKWRKVKWIAFFNVFAYMCFMLYLGYFILSYFDSNEFKHSIEKSKYEKEATQCNFSASLNYLSSRFKPPETSLNVTKTVEKRINLLASLVGRKKRSPSPLASSFVYNTTETEVIKLIEVDLVPFRICVIGSVLLALYELVQLLLSPAKYLFKFSNWLDIALIYLSFTVLLQSPYCIGEDTFKNYKALTILVMSAQTVQLIAKVSIFSMSIHMAIFKKVLVTFLKTISLYMLPILAFAMSFYTLNDSQRSATDISADANNKTLDEITNNMAESEDVRGFTDIYMSIITTIRMMLGDSGGFIIKKDNNFQNSILLLFIVLVTVVLFNLLNALAISDTEKIMKDAELVDFKKRVSVIYSYEKVFMFFGITFANIFPQLQTFVLKPHVDRTIIVPRMKTSGKNIVSLEKTFLKFLKLFNPLEQTSVYYSAFRGSTEKEMIRGTIFEAQNYSMGKKDFNKIVNFVKINYQ